MRNDRAVVILSAVLLSATAHAAEKKPLPPVVGGVVAPSGDSKMITPQVAAGQLAIDEKVAPHKAEFPKDFDGKETTYVAMLKICVNTEGSVSSKSFIKSAHPKLDDRIAAAVDTWRYKPYFVDGKAVPFCHVRSYVMTR